MRRPISTNLHAILDVRLGRRPDRLPWAFHFSDVPVATAVAMGVGTAVLGIALLTAHEGGVVSIVPLRAHLVVDALAGALLVASPWLFGFADEGANVWIPFVVLGTLSLVVPPLTEQASPHPPRRLLEPRSRAVYAHRDRPGPAA